MLRNKIDEIIRFVPTSLLVRRVAGTTPGTGSVNETALFIRLVLLLLYPPYDYMLRQKQTYSNMNPLMSSGGSRRRSTIKVKAYDDNINN